MPTPEAALVVDAGTWEPIAAFTGVNKPRGYRVDSSADSAEIVEVFVEGVHADAAPDEGDEGFALAPGGSIEITGFVGSGGRIRGVYARSTDAVITHGITIA